MNRYIRNCLLLAAIFASVVGVVPTAPQAAQAQAGTWYVSNSGSDANACNTPVAPCATIQAAVDKAASGDTVRVTARTYRGTITRVSKSVTLSGGWSEDFTALIGFSTLDGANDSLVLFVSGEPGQQFAVIGERLVIQNGQAYGVGGLSIGQTASVTLRESIIKDNVSLGAVAGGNNISNYGGSLSLINSEVAQTRNNGFAFSIYNTGNVALINSTLHSASGDPTSGIIENQFGTIHINSSSIRVGSGVGIRTNTPYASTNLSNSILMTVDSGSSACSGTLQSSGHNIINPITGCDFVPVRGDLQGVNPKLDLPFGTPAFFTLLPDSPAIDSGNPTGCKDHLGNPLLTDQRGSPRTLEGNGDGNIRCDIGAFEYDYENPLVVRQVFLPTIARNYCADFFDDFSNPFSGWPTGESNFVLAQYLNGEYRVQSKQPFLFLFRSPACERDNYVVEADMRWDGTASSDIGLLFGIKAGFSQYYLIDIFTDSQAYGIYRRNTDGSFTSIGGGGPPNVRPGTQINHIKVTRSGGQIILELNGGYAGTWFDNTITGPTRTGLAMAPYEDAPIADARFDNFRVTTIGAGALSLPNLMPERAANPGQPLPVDFPWRLPEHEWIVAQP